MKKLKVLAALMAVAMLTPLVAGCAGGQPMPPIKLLAGDTEAAKRYSMGIQEILRNNLGIEIQIENVDFNTRLQKMRNGEFSMCLAGWLGDYNDPSTFLDLWKTDSPYNDVKWSNKRYDELMNKARESSDPIERMKAMQEAEKILLEELPIVPLYWPQRNYVEQNYVKGVLRSVIGPEIDLKWAYTEGRPGGDDPQHLNLNLGENPPDLFSCTTTDVVSFDVLNHVMEGLVRLTPDGTYAQGSGLAESWTESEDGTHFEFKIKANAKWSDGSPVTAHDFEYAWKTALDPRTASQYNYMLFWIKGAEELANIQVPDKETDPQGYEAAIAKIEEAKKNLGVKAVDDRTLVVDLKNRTPWFISLLAFPTYFPVKESAHKKWGEEYATDKNKMLYCGPFVIDKWVPDSEMVLKKNPYYWDKDNVKLEYIHFDMIKDINTPVTMFDAQQLDTMGVPGDFIPKYLEAGMLKQMPDATCWYLELNLKDPLFQNAKIRKAISLAFDRKTFCDNVLRNYSKPATSFTPPTIQGENATVSFAEKYIGKVLNETANKEEAVKLFKQGLKELGYKYEPVKTGK
ncbi:MAG: hypothetical protein IMW97_04840 [Firmicutes bacterium]|nr:hypothetical protein [Candidatus Fermentithermobacillaceae bacterium]